MIPLLLGAIGIAALTMLGFPTVAPIVAGFLVGLGWPGRAARTAGGAGLVAWAVLLLVAALRGDAVGAIGAKLGAAMGVPGWAPLAATLLYPAILAASAAWMGQLMSPRRRRDAARSLSVAAPPRDA